MAKNKQQKQNVVEVYKNLLDKSSAVYFFSGSLNASNTQEIKKSLSDDARLTLIKNTLFNKASKNANIDVELNGYNNAVFVEKEIISNASTLNKFTTDNEYPVNYVLIGNSVYDGSKLKQIANLGSEAQVYGKFVGILAAPATVLVRSLQSPVQKLVYVLSQIQK